MLIKLTKNFEEFVQDEIRQQAKKGNDALINLRTFYQKICIEPNQKVDSLRFIIAVRHIEVITEMIGDDYPVNELADLIEQMRELGMYIKKGNKMKYSDGTKPKKQTKPKEIEETVSVGFNKRR